MFPPDDLLRDELGENEISKIHEIEMLWREALLPKQELLLVRRFVDSAFASRELLCSLIERIELTEDKRLIIRYRFSALGERA